jgi:hypothetical protein
MNNADAEEYTQALGQIVGGSWRQIALGQRLGVPQALGLTTRKWVEERLGGYVHMQLGDRREAVKELNGEGLSQRQIASVVGVNKDTVARDLNLRSGAYAPPVPGKPQVEIDAGGANAPLIPPPPREPITASKPRDDPERIERETRRSYQQGLVRFAEMNRYGGLQHPAQRERAVNYWPPVEPLDGADRVTPQAFREIAEISLSIADLLEEKGCDPNA